MKFGLIMTSYAYSPARVPIILRVLYSLAKTDVSDLSAVLVLVYRESPHMEYRDLDFLRRTFEVKAILDQDILPDTMFQGHRQSNLSTVAANKLLEEDKSITHLVFMYDDWVVNPQWLQELKKLIIRRPDGIAWSIYRSAYTRHHKVLELEGADCLMSMHDGLGCVTREEWVEYRTNHPSMDFSSDNKHPIAGDGAETFDIHHAINRPGKRWATTKDYWNNLDIHPGVTTDCAIDFVGEE